MKVKMSAQGGSASGGKKYFKQTIFCVVFLSGFLACQNVEAACTGASPTWTAANPSNAEITACINLASSGDTIIVPVGTANWTGSVRIPNNKKLTIQGSGVGVTTINSTSNHDLALGTSGSRVTGFTITGIRLLTSGNGFRIDHNYINTGGTRTAVISDSIDEAYVSPTGLIDNNTFINTGVIVFAGPMMNNTDWTLPTNLGKGDGAIYVEDNIFTRNLASAMNCIDANYGGAYVFRYNTVNGFYYEAHSVQYSTNRSAKRWEVYGNLQRKVEGVNTYYASRFRGGTGVKFFNRTEGDWVNRYIALDNVRSYETTAPFGKCDGSHAGVDGNEDATGYPCRDQIGRGPDAKLWVNSPPGAYTQPLEPAYFFANIGDSGPVTVDVINSSSDHIKANRDYYTYNASFDGKSGVGSGKLANRPDTCTTGVGYWATNQSCTDLTGMVGVNPATPISGTLYKCTATDTWTEYYTPYTYPHPLRTEASDIVAPAAPSGLAVS